MGYRCPGCGKDFGFDKEAFNNHLNFECGEGAAFAFAALAHVKVMCGRGKLSDNDVNGIGSMYNMLSKIRKS